MRRKPRAPFSNLNFENWQNLILVAVFFLYLSQFGFLFVKVNFLMGYDYLAFWSAGKIADDQGYTKIYDLENLRNIQIHILEDQGILQRGVESNFSPFPAPIFSFFVLPFQLLSRFNPKQSYWIWTSFNLAVLIGYLLFYIRKTLHVNSPLFSAKRTILLMLLSFPVILSLNEGQVEVFLVVCMGEFIRNGLNKKPFPSGLWLGGLLLKPQLLIIIIPLLIIQRNWKVLMGFFASSGLIIGSSFILSGYQGLKSLIDLWTQFGSGIATSSPESMINWRMVAVNLDSPFGWTVAIMGMILTLLAVYFLVRNNYSYGTPQWVMIMLGIFSATLAITWHSHLHMAVVLIPFLIYGSLSQMLSKKVVFLWAIVTPVILIILTTIALIVFFITKMKINDFGSLLLGVSGFFSNLAILGSVLHYFYEKNKTSGFPNPTESTG